MSWIINLLNFVITIFEYNFWLWQCRSIMSCLCPCWKGCGELSNVGVSLVKFPIRVLRWFIEKIPCWWWDINTFVAISFLSNYYYYYYLLFWSSSPFSGTSFVYDSSLHKWFIIFVSFFRVMLVIFVNILFLPTPLVFDEIHVECIKYIYTNMVLDCWNLFINFIGFIYYLFSNNFTHNSPT